MSPTDAGNEDIQQRYPRRTELAKERACTLRLLTADDRQAVLDLARALSPHDLLFLRRDITDEAVVDAWLEEVEEGVLHTVVAVDDDERLLGYGTLDRARLPWSRHVAEIRVVVGADARGLGLGRALTQEAFALALLHGLEKLVARMTLDQKAAIAVFEGLGFRPEGLLKEHVVDRQGRKHDLLVMSHDVESFERSRRGYGVTEALA